MKIIFTVGLVALFQAVAHSQSVTLNITAEKLKTSGGSAMPTSGLVVLVTSTLDSTFGGPTAGSFVSGDDAIVMKWDLTIGGGSGTGAFGPQTTGSTPLSNIANWTPGDPLQMYWYPTLTLGSSAPAAGDSYGQYRDAVGVDGSAIWTTPSGGSTISLNFFTSDATVLSSGGSNPAIVGNASFTVVPEPSEYAMVLGMACFAGAIIRRGLKAHSARS